MSTLTEVALFKACVYDPKIAFKLNEFNLDKISNP